MLLLSSTWACSTMFKCAILSFYIRLFFYSFFSFSHYCLSSQTLLSPACWLAINIIKARTHPPSFLPLLGSVARFIVFPGRSVGCQQLLFSPSLRGIDLISLLICTCHSSHPVARPRESRLIECLSDWLVVRLCVPYHWLAPITHWPHAHIKCVRLTCVWDVRCPGNESHAVCFYAIPANYAFGIDLLAQAILCPLRATLTPTLQTLLMKFLRKTKYVAFWRNFLSLLFLVARYLGSEILFWTVFEEYLQCSSLSPFTRHIRVFALAIHQFRYV